MSTAVMCIEGVIGEKERGEGFHPLIEGLQLLRSLKGGYRLVLTSIERDEENVERWLAMNGIAKIHNYEELVTRTRVQVDHSDTEVRVEQVTALRARGFDIRIFISADPEAVLMTTAAGILSLFYAHPSYGWEGFRPDRKKLPRSWQDIDDEVSHQRVLKATDPRLVEEEA